MLCSKKLSKKGIIGVSGYFLASLSPTLCHMCLQAFCIRLTIKMTMRLRMRRTMSTAITMRIGTKVQMNIMVKMKRCRFSIWIIKEDTAIATFGGNTVDDGEVITISTTPHFITDMECGT